MIAPEEDPPTAGDVWFFRVWFAALVIGTAWAILTSGWNP